MTEFMKVATLDELGENQIKAVEVGGHSIALVNAQGKIYAVSNLCTHAFCYFTYGWVDGTTLICSCHGGAFNLEDGRALNLLGNRPLACYAVQVEGNDIKVEIS